MSPDFIVEINDTSNPSAKLIILKGELDETVVDDFKAKLDTVLDDAKNQVFILNLHDLEFINSKGIGFLVSIHSHLAKDKRRLVIVDAQEAVMDVISLVGLNSIIPYYATIDEAINSL